MLAFLLDWLNLLIRWAHLIFGIGWIGASFYFVWLDFSLRRREAMNPGVYGTSWMVHGGGFYHVEKYSVAPPELPPDLHWFKWEAYLTFLTGLGLMVVQYYFNARAYLIDPTVADLAPAGAIALSLISLVAGFLIYDALCRSPIGRKPALLAGLVFLLILGASWFFSHVFSGRGALIHAGAFIGTIMAVNVFAVIIPNQRIMVGQLMRGETPDGRLGAIGKQRSLHNNYLTLPVLVMMVSNHYPLLTGSPHAPLLVGLIIVIGAMIRHLINRHDAGDPFHGIAWTLPAAAVALLAAVVLSIPAPAGATAGSVGDARAVAIATARCSPCHAVHPTNQAFSEAPKGIHLQTLAELRQYAGQIEQQAVLTHAMPLGNATGMTDAERGEMGAWIAGQR